MTDNIKKFLKEVSTNEAMFAALNNLNAAYPDVEENKVKLIELAKEHGIELTMDELSMYELETATIKRSNAELSDETLDEIAGVSDIGLSMSAAFTIFAKKVAREKRIPFELNVDPFYSEDNLRRLATAIADANAGTNMSEHELIEVD